VDNFYFIYSRIFSFLSYLLFLEHQHDGGDTLLTAFEEDVDVTVHKYPGVDGAFPVDDVLAEPLKEQGLVLVILEDV